MKYLILVVLLFTACTRQCQQWQEGKNCERITSKFEGNYFGYLETSHITDTLTVPITEHTEPNKLIIAATWLAILTSSSTFEIPNQQINNFEIEGHGILIGDSLHLYYTQDNLFIEFHGEKK